MKRTLITLLSLALIGGTTQMHAQFLERLGRAAQRAAENAVERNVEKKIEDGVDKAFDEDTYKKKEQKAQEIQTPQGWTCPSCGATGNAGKFCGECGTKQPTGDGSWTCAACGHAGNTGKFCGECGAKQGGAAQASASEESQQPASAPVKKAIETAYAKSDFVAGDEIIFEDDVTREQLGEFPSQWDLLRGNIEVAQINGDKAILCVSQDDPEIAPLFDNMTNYLPEKFTIEFDFWVDAYAEQDGNKPENHYIIEFLDERKVELHEIDLSNWYYSADDFYTQLNWGYRPSSENTERRSGQDDSFRTNPNAWNHLAISFNKRAMKVYLNGIRYINIPNMVAPRNFKIKFYRTGGYFTHNTSIRNIRIAQGAVPLYDRMMSDGKFITYGITFDVGKATIKPESMGEINRIVKLMTENPDLKFSVEGHTDATGNAASNQTLSEQRAQAIVDKLVELGIANERLTAVGKGQSNPIADNNTDEGRAKNRRVEFVKQ